MNFNDEIRREYGKVKLYCSGTCKKEVVMEKKRFKMYKKGKKWLVAPIVFLGILGASAFATDQHSAYADEATKIEVAQTADQAPSKTEQQSIVDEQTDEAAQPETPVVNSEQPTEPAVPETNEEESVGEKEPEDSIETPKAEAENEISEPSIDQQEESTLVSEQSETEENIVKEPTAETPKVESPVSTHDKAESKPASSKAAPVVATKTQATTKANTTPTISIYRVYNPNSGEHLHTKNSYEKDYLVRLGWRYEGVSMVVTTTGNQLYRIYNPNSGEHHFTLNMNEINMLKRAGWRYEGVAWLTPKSGIAMYRVFNPNSRGAGSHHYTMNVNERNDLLKAGWRNEGVSWYTLGTKSRQEIMLDWFYARQGKVTYSMTNRTGPNSYDCSSAIFYALIEAGYLNTGTWIGNTDTLFSYEGKLFKVISSNDVRRGDIFIAGRRGNSGGAAGHTGVATSNSTIIHCNYTDNGISETVISGRTGDPVYWFRFI